jgi:hypothetical protein
MRASISQTIKQLGGGLAALGVRVEKPSAAKPISDASDDLFIVRGGKILVTSLIGQVTVLITDVGVDNAKLQHTPTTGAMAAVDICNVLDIGGDIVGSIYIITGAAAAMQNDGGVGVWIASMGTNLLILQPGTISLTCSGTETGSIKWLLHYIAVDTNAYVVPAL